MIIGATRSLSEVADALAKASAAYCEAESNARRATRASCDAINALNAVQKEFDAVVAALKDKSPRDSDWKQRADKRVTP